MFGIDSEASYGRMGTNEALKPRVDFEGLERALVSNMLVLQV